MTDQSNGLPSSPAETADSPGKRSSIGSAAVATPATGLSGGPLLNPRSCVTCRRRKVKCNKQYPCSNCLKAHIDCIFPAPGRAPRRPRKPPDGELLVRLRRLEGVIQSLGVQVDDDPRLSGSTSGDVHARDSGSKNATAPHEEGNMSFPNEQTYEQRRDSLTMLGADLGRLVINEGGRSKYVNNRFWAALNSEVEDLKEVIDDSSGDETELPSPVTDSVQTPSHHGGFLFNVSTNANDLHLLHPPADQIQKYWLLFVEHCDPLMKMLHVPTMQQQVYAVANNPGKGSRAMEVLLFAVYYAIVTSLSPDECIALSGETQESMSKRYRFGLEQALVRAHFLVTEEIIVLQAFIIFLICLRRFEDPRILWSLTGVACRIATTLGLHHDGTGLGISPFDTEIRRRTWWQILILDIRSSEDHGNDPVIIQHTFDTRFPLNVEDDDISPAMTDTPTERVGITKMSFCLTRYYTAMNFARLFARPANFLSPTGSWPEPTFQERQKWIQQCQRRLEERFFRYYDMEKPLHWITYTVSKLIMAKQWLMVYQPFLRSKLGSELPAPLREHLFMTSLEAVESSVKLEKRRVTVKWGWLFKTYTQFHAMAFLLSDLARRPIGPLVDRAWQAVEDTKRYHWQADSDTKKGPLIKSLLKLEVAARSARRKALAQVEGSDSDQETDEDAKAEENEPPAQSADFTMANTALVNNQSMYGFEHQNHAANMGFNSAGFQAGFGTHPMQTVGNFYSPEMGGGMVLQPQFASVGQGVVPWPDVLSTQMAANRTIPTGDWFGDANFGSLPGLDTNGIGFGLGAQQGTQQGVQQQQQQQQQQQLFQIQPHLQQQQHNDPMVSGSEGSAAQWPEWDEVWDDMMTTVPTPGTQWQRRPVMTETWL